MSSRAFEASVRASEAHVRACDAHVRMCESSERRSQTDIALAVAARRAESKAETALAVAAGVAVAAVAAGAAAVAVTALKPDVKQRYTLDAEEGTGPVEERIIEYERKLPFKGFASRHLFPNEPQFKRGDGSGLALLSKEDLLLPAGWTWLDGDWGVVIGARANASGTDRDGWMYAFNWVGDNGYGAIGGMKDCVRRRIWTRKRVPSRPSQDAGAAASRQPRVHTKEMFEDRTNDEKKQEQEDQISRAVLIPSANSIRFPTMNMDGSAPLPSAPARGQLTDS